MPTDWEPYSARLRSELDRLAALSDKLLDASSIEYRGDFNRGGGVIFIAPDWAWAKPNASLTRRTGPPEVRFHAQIEVSSQGFEP
jgi:hypothetical protein